MRRPSHQQRQQRGLSLVELMVGLTVGLLVVAAASMMMAGQLVENRRLLAGAQVQQDLRAAADIISRELRRASRLSEVAVATTPSVLDTIDSFVGTSSTAALKQNNLIPVTLANSNTEVSFAYVASDTGTINPAYKFRWNTSAGTLQSDLGNGSGYQDLTDANTLRVTNFTLTTSNAGTTPLPLPCTQPCPSTSANPTDCWPTYNVRWLNFTIAAESRADPSIKREVVGRVRIRSDALNFASSSPAQICP